MKSALEFYLNGEKKIVSGEWAFKPLADYLRYSQQMTGTKIVCAEGDCGACSVLVESLSYQPINACIVPLYSVHGDHIVTVEGIGKDSLHPVQTHMIEENGAQCGYCTPGFICALAGYYENRLATNKAPSRKSAQNAMTGNLCRCTGYDSILKAAESLVPKPQFSLQKKYESSARKSEMKKIKEEPVLLKTENLEVFLPTEWHEALRWRAENPQGRIIAGSTDLGVLINKGKLSAQKWMSVHMIKELHDVVEDHEQWLIGSQVSLSQLEKQKNLPQGFLNLLHVFASPQIKNRATLVGNLVNASPIGDTIPAMLLMGAELQIESEKNGVRFLPLENFYLDYKKIDLKPDELVKGVRFSKAQWPLMRLYKMSLRRDLDISAVTFAGALTLEKGQILECKIFFGGVGPTVLRLPQIEKFLQGKKFEEESFAQSAQLISNLLKPFSDVRGSQEFRLKLCEQALLRFYFELREEVLGEVPA